MLKGCVIVVHFFLSERTDLHQFVVNAWDRTYKIADLPTGIKGHSFGKGYRARHNEWQSTTVLLKKGR